MRNITYTFFDDENVVIERINSLVDLMKNELQKTQDLYVEDLYLWSA